jgi:hypothetical protein
MKLEATFTLERETKNTYRYQEELSGSGKPPVIGTLYIQKWALDSHPQEDSDEDSDHSRGTRFTEGEAEV